MDRVFGKVRSYPKTALITASLIIAVAGFWFTSTRTPEDSASKDFLKETTYSTETTGPRFGAAVYFPQGTNPSLLEELAPEVAGVGPVTIEEARWNRDEIAAFGTFSREGIRCELLAGGVVVSSEESEPILQTAGDAFLQTFRPHYREGTTYSVRCGISGRMFDRRLVSGSPSNVSP